MRAIHFVRPTGSSRLEPLCGDWGSMDTHWTADVAGVTCVPCREALRKIASSGPPRPPFSAGAGPAMVRH
jgi:hypothetical protein